MSEQTILHIRETIAEARRVERETRTLEKYLQGRAPYLHPAIGLPADEADRTLLAFVTSYIEHVPDFLEALSVLMREAGILKQAEPLIKIAADFFITPPEVVSEHTGMHALIDEAYLAHRLMEEINDRVMMQWGMPLTPMDMTVSNVVVHSLLGEEFANQLDLAVHYAVEALTPLETLLQHANFRRYLTLYRRKGWESTLKRWPCLAGDSSISLQLQSESRRVMLH